MTISREPIRHERGCAQPGTHPRRRHQYLRSKGVTVSELDVIIIHIRADQAAEYERLFAEQELPRWREYKARGAFLSARISRVAFGTDDRGAIAKYAIVVEVPSH